MSKYTTEVRFICEQAAGLTESAGYRDMDRIIETAIPKIFDFSFPIYDESHRHDLEKKIIQTYYFREIGLETVALWKAFMAAKLNLIMPKYNQLYEIAAKRYDIFGDVDYIREGYRTGENAGSESSSASGSGSAESMNARSDTPQGGLSDLEDLEYLTEATKITGSNSNSESRSSSHSGTDRDDHYERVHGKQGSASYTSLVKEAREAVINIDEMIVRECADLFMNIY